MIFPSKIWQAHYFFCIMPSFPSLLNRKIRLGICSVNKSSEIPLACFVFEALPNSRKKEAANKSKCATEAATNWTKILMKNDDKTVLYDKKYVIMKSLSLSSSQNVVMTNRTPVHTDNDKRLCSLRMCAERNPQNYPRLRWYETTLNSMDHLTGRMSGFSFLSCIQNSRDAKLVQQFEWNSKFFWYFQF